MDLRPLGIIPPSLPGLAWLEKYASPRFGRRPTTHRHIEMEANLVTAGTCRYLIREHKQDLAARDFMWLFPDQDHMLLEASDDFEMWVVVAAPHFVAERLPDSVYLASAGQPLSRPHRLSHADARLLADTAGALTLAEADPPHYGDGLAWWIRGAERAVAAAPSRRGIRLPAAVARAIAVLEREPDIGLPALALRVNMSASRLSHVFAAGTGRSITDYRNGVRLRRVSAILRSGSFRGLTDAALAAGFGSYAQFARVLRKVEQTSPKARLRELREDAGLPP